MTEPTCGTCRHWHAGPRNTMDLGQPQQGDCREGPPHATSLPNPPQMMMFCNYPRLPATFPACSRHQPKVEIA